MYYCGLEVSLKSTHVYIDDEQRQVCEASRRPDHVHRVEQRLSKGTDTGACRSQGGRAERLDHGGQSHIAFFCRRLKTTE